MTLFSFRFSTDFQTVIKRFPVKSQKISGHMDKAFATETVDFGSISDRVKQTIKIELPQKTTNYIASLLDVQQ